MLDPATTALVPPATLRRVFANRTLNLGGIAAVGFDMDYTLVHYRVDEWERAAFGHARSRLAARGWPVETMEFSPTAFTLGLVIDRELGNVVKANRFGFVRRAAHGNSMLGFDEQRDAYSRVIVDLAEPRWYFMNTLFSLSEACLFANLVDLVDAGKLPAGVGYDEAFRAVRTSLDAAHVEGELKAEIIREPERFVVLDEEAALALIDLKNAGKKLLVITNSEWSYLKAMMGHAFDRFAGGSWRRLFDVVIVQARKPDFFTGNAPIFEVVDDDGLLRPGRGPLRAGGAYFGGNARLVEQLVGLPGETILYVGDHIYADVHVTKSLLRWRTALILRELEDEIAAIESFRTKQVTLDRLMSEKERLEWEYDELRVGLLRADGGQGKAPSVPIASVKRRMSELRRAIEAFDEQVGPLSKEASELVNVRWGPPMRAGNDKSHLARQVERYADVYTSRVANLLHATPFGYLRSPRGTMPHDGGASGGSHSG
ncbi:MAG TPA: HAD-IG family 5'-nucleotidase [Polyangiaceae bacterium]|nr:HAD-IG family 5'-nucleotidase [Polyangiaceae bacterium]